MAVMIKLLNEILDPAREGRDQLINQLNADLAHGDYDLAEREVIVRSLIDLAGNTSDPRLTESIYNLLEDCFYEGSCALEIVEAAVTQLPTLGTASLVHALPIIAYSQRADKLEILAPYLAGLDPVVRELMSAILDAGNLDYLLR